jgi:hypothetical protein
VFSCINNLIKQVKTRPINLLFQNLKASLKAVENGLVWLLRNTTLVPPSTNKTVTGIHCYDQTYRYGQLRNMTGGVLCFVRNNIFSRCSFCLGPFVPFYATGVEYDG